MMALDQFLDTATRRLLLVFVGFGIPMVLFALQVFLGWGSVPLMIITLTWLGFAILFYMGLEGEETGQ